MRKHLFIRCEKCGECCQCAIEPARDQKPVSDLPGAADAGVRTKLGSGGIVPEAWRRELSARLNRYRARHKAPPPHYPSLQLPIGPPAHALNNGILEPSPTGLLHSAVENAVQGKAELEAGGALPVSGSRVESSEPQSGGRRSAKIIEFPRFAWAPAEPLAEPVSDRPRILEVPEVAPPPPALGGITMDPAGVAEPEKRPAIDSPRERSPLGRRLLASAVDGLMVGAASALFGFIFWKVAGFRPPQMQLYGLAAGIPCLFWVVYQYWLIVYAGSTPGLRLARIELTCFDGRPARRSLRRWRVLASYLSAASLGMGYVWLFLDQDNLCWHDRITRSYLAAGQAGFGELRRRGFPPRPQTSVRARATRLLPIRPTNSAENAGGAMNSG